MLAISSNSMSSLRSLLMFNHPRMLIHYYHVGLTARVIARRTSSGLMGNLGDFLKTAAGDFSSLLMGHFILVLYLLLVVICIIFLLCSEMATFKSCAPPAFPLP